MLNKLLKRFVNALDSNKKWADLVITCIALIWALSICIFLLLGGSWIITCGLIKLITLCFGWTFYWGISTGIWIIIFVLRLSINGFIDKIKGD